MKIIKGSTDTTKKVIAFLLAHFTVLKGKKTLRVTQVTSTSAVLNVTHKHFTRKCDLLPFLFVLLPPLCVCCVQNFILNSSTTLQNGSITFFKGNLEKKPRKDVHWPLLKKMLGQFWFFYPLIQPQLRWTTATIIITSNEMCVFHTNINGFVFLIYASNYFYYK